MQKYEKPNGCSLILVVWVVDRWNRKLMKIYKNKVEIRLACVIDFSWIFGPCGVDFGVILGKKIDQIEVWKGREGAEAAKNEKL